jgi:hypothetical protein
MTEPKCGTCRFWHKAPTNPLDLANSGQGPVGECRGAPPALVGFPTQTRAGVQMQFVAKYPDLKADTKPCRLYEDAEQEKRYDEMMRKQGQPKPNA